LDKTSKNALCLADSAHKPLWRTLYSYLAMAHNPKFGPAAQTPEQRAWVLQQMQFMIPSLRKATAQMQQLYARYVAGELLV
jgi:hypothetical protein